MPKKDWMVKESDLEKDDIQYKVLKGMNEKSAIVTGCAGSGKSVLALIKAQRIQKEKGNDYQIIVYTKSLCQYMNSGREELNLVKDLAYHQEWKYKRIPKTYANGVTYMVYEKDEYGNYIPKDNLPQADYTIVDEIQDFTKEEIGEFISATRKHFYFFGDTAQSVFKGLKNTLPVEYILYEFPEYREPKTQTFKLYNNYRLPLSVAKLAQNIGEDLPEFDESIYKSPEKQKPYLLEFAGDEQHIDFLIETIKKRELRDVGILVLENVSVKEISIAMRAKGMDNEVKYKDPETGRPIDTLNFSTSLPKIMTYHSAKGLQFESVFLPMLPTVIQRRSALYVAMTRTYHYLYLMYSGSLLDLFANASKEDYLTSTDIIVEEK